MEALADNQLEFLADVQYVLSAEVTVFLHAADGILRRLSQTTHLETQEARVPLGVVNWPATVQRRRIAGNDGLGFVLRRNEVHRDLPENRLLRGLLLDLVQRADKILAARRGDSRWHDQVGQTLERAEGLARNPLLAPVPAQITTVGARAAASSRVSGYRAVAKVHALFRSLYREGDRDRLLELFRQAELVPEKEDRRFELLLLFRLLTHLESQGAVCERIRLIGRGDGPVFTYRHGNIHIDVFFQGLPDYLADRSLYSKMAQASSFGKSLRRPDIIVKLISPPAPPGVLLFEAKCSTEPATIRDGIFQVLAYAGDLQLHLEASAKLVVVAFKADRYPDWPTAFPVDGFLGTVTDLAGFGTTLEALGLLPPGVIAP